MSKTRKPEQKRSRATVSAIVDAGFIALARHGMEGITTHHIADIAGVSVGSLYEYFANKEAVLTAMNEQVIQEVVNMIRPLILELVEMDVHQAITTLLYRFRDLLQRNDGRYLKYASYAVYLSPQQHLGPVNRVLTELLLQYLMRHPNMGRKGNIPTMSYIVITGGVYTVIRYLGEENPPISFDQLVEGLANMVTQLAGRDSRKGNAR